MGLIETSVQGRA